MNQWLNSLPAEKRNIYGVLLGIILLTIPCYCLGIAALAAAPPVELPTPTPFGFTVTPAPSQEIPSFLPDTATPTITPTPSPRTPTATLEPTPTQLFPTVPPTNTPTSVPATATPSPTVPPTTTPTGTTTPTNTPSPTATPNLTATAAANNKPPEARDDTATTPQGTAVVINVIANDVDPNGNLNPASVTVVSAPANGTTTVDGSGKITFTPNANFTGTNAFTYQVCDTLEACATATVTVTVTAVNKPPLANDDSATTVQGTAVNIDVLANDSDPEGNLDPASVTVVTGPVNGTTSVGNGRITYTPEPNFSGTNTFTYQVCDTGGACATATVTVNVTAANKPPVANDDSATTAQDTPVNIDVLANDSDPEGNLDPSTLAIENGPGNGNASVRQSHRINYRPKAGFNGDDTFTYKICDTAGACSTATVTVKVTP